MQPGPLARQWPGRLAAAALAIFAVTVKVLTLVVPPPGGAYAAAGAETGLAPFLDVTLFTLVQLLYLGLTCLLVASRPRHRITWLMAAIVVFAVVGGLSEAVTQLDPSPTPWWWDLAAWIRAWYFAPFLGAYVLLFHLFPTGRPINGRLAWGTRAAFIATTLTTFVLMVGPADDQGVPNPLEVSFPEPISIPFTMVLAVAWVITLLTIVPILVVRFRRSSGEESQQLKWFSFCAAAAFGLWWAQPWAAWVFLVATLLPGIGIAVALLRYRLYDIDRIISRTTSYALLTGLLIATYGAVVTAVSKLVGTDSSVAIAAATLTAAALARPILRRLQQSVDRRFDRSHYDAIQTVETFGARMRDEVDPHEIRAMLVGTVTSSLNPRQVTVWVRDG